MLSLNAGKLKRPWNPYRSCWEIKESGEVCRAYRRPVSDFCVAHDPETRAAVLQNLQKGREKSREGAKKPGISPARAGLLDACANNLFDERVLVGNPGVNSKEEFRGYLMEVGGHMLLGNLDPVGAAHFVKLQPTILKTFDDAAEESPAGAILELSAGIGDALGNPQSKEPREEEGRREKDAAPEGSEPTDLEEGVTLDSLPPDPEETSPEQEEGEKELG